MSQKLRFAAAGQTAFFATTRQRVNAYFEEKNLSRNANGAMWAKVAFFLGGYVLFYGLILSNQFGPWAMLGLAMLLGAFAAFVGFNVSHDAMHGALSGRAWVNDLVSTSFYLLGANPYVWKLSHNLVHHTYTNIPGHDEDIMVAPGLVRIEPADPYRPWQRYQHVYAFLLYGLASLSWVFAKDYRKFFQKQIGQCQTVHPRREYINLFIYKVAYYALFIALPLWVLDITWGQFLLGFVAMHLAEGLVLGLVFQLAHVVEGTAFPEPDSSNTIGEVWAIHQMQTTANFARRSRLVNFFCGGLNMQIEHHLFPKICHIHYPALAKIVKHTALEHGVPYIEQPTFASALRSHYRILKKLGRQPAPEPVTNQPHWEVQHS